jgi:type VI secretion system secreted protein Hcp
LTTNQPVLSSQSNFLIMKKLVQNPICLLLLAAFMSLNVSTFAQGSALYLKVKGAKQGDIKGDVTEKGKENLIRTISFQHEVASPRDAASGQATGKRQHSPLVITKEIDKSSPLLMSALTSNENLSEVTLTFYRPGKAIGVNELWYTIALKNASISDIKSTWVSEKKMSLEEVSFSYEKIKWTYADGNVTHEDSWGSSKN